MLPSVEGYQVAVDLVARTAGQLRFVVRFERKDVKSVTTNNDRTRVLSRNRQTLFNDACFHVYNGNLILRRQCHIRLLIVGEGDADWLIEERGF